MWNSDSPDRFGEHIAVAGFLVACSANCEARLRQRVDDVTNWAAMPIAELVAMLAIATRVSMEVADRIEDAALADHVRRGDQAIQQQHNKQRSDSRETA
jgi:hypothetical protein